MKENGELVALYIVDTSLSDDVRERLQDLGFLGERPSDQLLEEMRREQERQGKGELARIRELAGRRGVDCRTNLVEGEFLESSLEVARKESADAIFVTRRERSAISRLVAGSVVASLRNAAPCRVLVHDPRGSEG